MSGGHLTPPLPKESEETGGCERGEGDGSLRAAGVGGGGGGATEAAEQTGEEVADRLERVLRRGRGG